MTNEIKLPERLPCLFMEGKSGEGGAVVLGEIPFPGMSGDFLTDAYDTDSIKCFEMFVHKHKAFLILSIPYVYDGEQPRYAGVLVSLTSMEKSKDGMLFIEVKSIARVKIINLGNNDDNLLEANWEVIEEMHPPEDVSIEELRKNLSSLIYLADSALTVAQEDEALIEISKLHIEVINNLFSREDVGRITDSVAHYLNKFLSIPGVPQLISLLLFEGDVEKRLENTIKGYKELIDEIGIKKITAKEELDQKENTSIRVVRNSSSDERDILDGIPKKLPCFFMEDHLDEKPLWIYLPGHLMKFPVSLTGNNPYLIFFPRGSSSNIEEEGGKRAAMIIRLILVLGEEEQMIVYEILSRVYVTDFIPASESDDGVRYAKWEPFKEKYPSKKICSSKDFREKIERLVSAEVKILEIKTGVVYSRERVTSVMSYILNRDKNLRLITELIDSSGDHLNMFVDTIEGISDYLYQIFIQEDVLMRMGTTIEALELVVGHIQGTDSEKRKQSRMKFRRDGEGDLEYEEDINAIRAERIIFEKNDSQEEIFEENPPEEEQKTLDISRFSNEIEELRAFYGRKIIGEKGQARAGRILSRIHEFYLGPLWRPEGPIGVTLLLGPSGVGKTETAKTLAEFLLGSKNALTRIDCGEYQSQHEISKLIGAPPGYIGYTDRPLFAQENIDRPAIKQLIKSLERDLSEAGDVKRADLIKSEIEYYTKQIQVYIHQGSASQNESKPTRTADDSEFDPVFSILLFDEIEKAHPALFKLLLNIVGEGRVQLGSGELVSFYHSYIILTSNIGSEEIARLVSGKETGFQRRNQSKERSDKDIYNLAVKQLQKVFAPEFLGRIQDSIVVYSKLTEEELRKVQSKELEENLFSPLKESFPIDLIVQDDVKEFILRESGDHPEYGARELRFKIKRLLTVPLSSLINSGQVKKGDRVIATLKKDKDKERVFFSREPKID
jgi:DNA polymerase III delta prime subunit